MANFSKLIFLGIALISFSLQAQTTFVANLAGRNQTTPVVTMASGEVTLQISNNQLIVSGSFSNLSDELATDIAGGAHLHAGYAGQNGGILQNLTVTADADLKGGTFEAANNTFPLTSELQAAIDERRLYVNVHSLSHPGGELRGQFLRGDANSYYTSNLFGSNEIPSVITRGHGALSIEIKGTTIAISGSFADLEGDFDATVNGGAHLHLANAGTNGTIYFPLVATVDPDGKGGVFTLEDNTLTVDGSELTPFSSRNLYANIHTTAHPSGEIRGQVVGQASVVLRSRLTGSSQVPVLNTIGDGIVLTEIFPDSTLVVSGSFNRLSSSLDVSIAGGMHIHQGLAGQSGSVLIPLSVVPNGDLKGGTLTAPDNGYTADAATLEALLNRSTYLNVHTVNHAGGELRGQNLPESNAYFHGFVSGNSSAPAHASTGTGLIVGEWLGDQLTLSGSFSDLRSAVNTEIAGGIHLHSAMIGSNGPIEFPLTMLLDEDALGAQLMADSNTFDLEEDQRQQLLERGMYVNVHTMDAPGGEVRAQLLHEATTFYIAPLSGASHTPPFETSAFGTVAVEVSEDRAFLTGSFSGLSSDYATAVGSHIHTGMAGQNSDVIFALQPTLGDDNRSGTYFASDNTFTLNFNQRSDLSARKDYVNIHTVDRPAGAIRGQLLPLATAYFTTSLLGSNVPTPIISEGRGEVKLELTGNQLVASGSFRSLASTLATELGGGAHIHLGAAGETGDVAFPLTASQTLNLLGGLFTPQDNTFELTDEQVEALFGEMYYINIHTALNMDGEIRSQILPEVNFYPSAPEITFPANGETLVLEGDSAMAFTANWMPAVDSNRVIYTWQLSAIPDFTGILVSENVGTDLSFSTTFGIVDDLLALAGIEVGASINLYHRVIATDGSLTKVGAGSLVTIQRGEVTGIRDFLPRENWGLRVYPTLSRPNSEINVNIRAARSTEAQLVLFTGTGQQLRTENIQLLQGDNRQSIQLPDLSAGTYYINLIVNGQLLPAQRILVGK
ncbi:CHRD domain-containing protein [Flavilitoribacter nigricans]|nr:CHRD domain-containing protein [Flavilitoribacter nigricans]